MPQKKRSILQPEYMSRFSCIGGACEDNCCEGNWTIFVDKNTYLKYRNVGNAELQPLIDDAVKRNRGDDADESQYGKFKIRQDGRGCPLLTPEKLCRVHAALGYDMLCDICAVYPRLYKMADGKIERSGLLSCPEIARVALCDPNGIAFETVEEGGSVGRIPLRVPSLDSKSPQFASKAAKFLWDIRIFCLTLLQNRDFSMGHRMIILGMLCRKLDELDREGRTDEIPGLLEKLGAGLEDESIKESLGAVGSNFEIQMRLAKELTDKRLESDLVSHSAYIQCLKETFIGLDMVVGTPVEQVVKKYTENREKYVNGYLKEKEYILENFVVNEFFSRLMPFGAGENPAWDSYLFLCVMYGMVKLHLNGMAGCHKGLTDEIVLKAVQSFSKVVIHSNKFIPGMMQLLKSCGYDTLAWMTILVND